MKVNKKDTKKTSNDVVLMPLLLTQLISLQCLYCKFFTHFPASLIFVPLTLNMKLFAGQLSSFCEDMWEIHREAAMYKIVPRSSCFTYSKKAMLCITFEGALLRRSSFVVKLDMPNPANLQNIERFTYFHIFWLVLQIRVFISLNNG